MYKKLLGIINEDFDATTGQLLIICCTLEVNLPCSINISICLSEIQQNAHKKQPQHTKCTWLLKGRRTSEG